ncbi:MAG: hypothetical protein D6731_04040 [Planctomycetota bacterium]|nr:MAG: hypothetical protein D6731_04040 [Planctomycetota bacterium]
MDADRDGAPEGVAAIDFGTTTLTLVPGTAVCGRVFASERGDEGANRPLAGVRVTVDGAEASLFAETDAFGNFRLDPAPAGRFFVHVDGRNARAPVPPGAYYPTVGKAFVSVPGTETNLPDNHLPLVGEDVLAPLAPQGPTTVRFPPSILNAHPELAGTEGTVPQGSLFFDDGRPGGRVGIAPVAPDRLPGPLPEGLDFGIVFALQTDGATNFDLPAAVRFPNTLGTQPRGKASLWSFDHDAGRWTVVGTLTASPDGRCLVSDPGSGIRAPGRHAVQQPSQVGDGGEPSAAEPGRRDTSRESGEARSAFFPRRCLRISARLAFSAAVLGTGFQARSPGRGTRGSATSTPGVSKRA